jgi:hypothetical protein
MLQAILVISIILSSAILIVPVTNANAFAFKYKPVLLNPRASTYLGANWWKWVLEIPTPINPLIDANPCNVNQHGLFFFLAGVFEQVSSSSTSSTSSTSNPSHAFQTNESSHYSKTGSASDSSDHVDRTCTIPKEKAIFFPVYNTFVTFGPTPPDPTQPANLRDAIKIVKDNVDQATNLKASVDGTNINVNMLRSLTIPFEFTLPHNNIFGITNSSLLGPYNAVADGYWVALRPLTVGTHEISFSSSHPDGPNIDVTYHITVQ